MYIPSFSGIFQQIWAIKCTFYCQTVV